MRHLSMFVLTAVLLGLTGCVSLPGDVERAATHHADLDRVPSRIAAKLAPELRRHPGQSGFWLLATGLDAYAARVLLAEAAGRSLDVQYYLYHDDLTGRMLNRGLLRAADRGVRVRLLLDDMATPRMDGILTALDSHPEIQVRILNPFANRDFRGVEMLVRFDQVSRRMHNKSFTVDNVLTIVGGRNVGDEYFDAHEDVNFADMDVLAAGPAALKVGKQFDLYWNSPLAYPVTALTAEQGDLDALRRDLEAVAEAKRDSPYAERLRTSNLIRRIETRTLDFEWGEALVFYDLPEKLVTDPEDRSTHLGPKLRPYVVEGIDRHLLIFSPYFVPGEEGVEALTALAKRGVRVRVVTNSLASTDVGIVHSGYAPYRVPLLRGGVELYELKPDAEAPSARKLLNLPGSSGASLHSKTSVLDREVLFVGSPNLDPRSGKLNTELGILFMSEPLASAVAEWFEVHASEVAYRLSLDESHCGSEGRCDEGILWTTIEGGEEVVYRQEPKTGAVTRFIVALLSLLPIEGQL
jgi:putative cardiolipin synthase